MTKRWRSVARSLSGEPRWNVRARDNRYRRIAQTLVATGGCYRRLYLCCVAHVTAQKQERLSLSARRVASPFKKSPPYISQSMDVWLPRAGPVSNLSPTGQITIPTVEGINSSLSLSLSLSLWSLSCLTPNLFVRAPCVRCTYVRIIPRVLERHRRSFLPSTLSISLYPSIPVPLARAKRERVTIATQNK